MNLPIAIASIIGKHTGMLRERLLFVVMIFASGLGLISCSAPSGDGVRPGQGQYGLGAYQQAGGRVAGMENPVTVRVGGGDGVVAALKGKGITPEDGKALKINLGIKVIRRRLSSLGRQVNLC